MQSLCNVISSNIASDQFGMISAKNIRTRNRSTIYSLEWTIL